MMREILERRCLGLGPDDELFKGVSAEHIHSMAMRLYYPRRLVAPGLQEVAQQFVAQFSEITDCCAAMAAVTRIPPRVANAVPHSRLLISQAAT